MAPPASRYRTSPSTAHRSTCGRGSSTTRSRSSATGSSPDVWPRLARKAPPFVADSASKGMTPSRPVAVKTTSARDNPSSRRYGGEAEVRSGEAGGGVGVADLDDSAERAGRVGGAAPDGTVADDEDRLAVQGEAGHVQEGVGRHQADQVPVVQALFDRDPVPVEDRVGEVQAGEPLYPGPRGLQSAAHARQAPPGGGGGVGAHLGEQGRLRVVSRSSGGRRAGRAGRWPAPGRRRPALRGARPRRRGSWPGSRRGRRPPRPGS